jgi:hypothetical protein
MIKPKDETVTIRMALRTIAHTGEMAIDNLDLTSEEGKADLDAALTTITEQIMVVFKALSPHTETEAQRAAGAAFELQQRAGRAYGKKAPPSGPPYRSPFRLPSDHGDA